MREIDKSCWSMLGSHDVMVLYEQWMRVKGEQMLWPMDAITECISTLYELEGQYFARSNRPLERAERVSIKDALQWPRVQRETLMRATSWIEWHHAHRYCGVCGTSLIDQVQEGCRLCPSCGHKVFPSLSPAIMVLVCKGDELLLARSPHFKKGVYSALAGFVEVGESAEQALRREVLEEVGIQVKNIRYFGSQSWPFPKSFMLAYFADYDAGELVIDPHEIEEASWFAYDALPALPSPTSIAYALIQEGVRRMQQDDG